MGINKNRVFDANQIHNLSAKTQQLMTTADAVITEIYNELCRVSSTLEKLPSDVRDNGLKANVENLKRTIKSNEFKEYHDKVDKSLKNLVDTVEKQDTRIGKKIDMITNSMNIMTKRIQSLQNLIPTGSDSGTYEDFEKEFKQCTALWGTVNEALKKVMDKLAASLKGGKNEAVCFSKDPVNLSTGNFIYEKVDLEVEGTPMLSMKRFYNEMDKREGVFGKGWRHPYEIRLLTEGEEYTVILADGKEESFQRKSDGSFWGETTYNRLCQEGTGYQYRTVKGDTYYFNNDGQYVAWTDENNNKLNLTYIDDNISRVDRVGDGAYFEFTYNNDGRLIRISDQENRSITYTYDDKSHLHKVTNDSGESYTYSYNEEGRIITVTNPVGVVTVENEFDEEGRTILQTFPDGGKMSYEYNEEEKNVVLTERNGSKTTYYHDERYRNIHTVYEDGEEYFLYNRKGQRTMHKDCNGNITRYAYDVHGNVTQVIDPLGRKVNATYDSGNRLLKLSVNGVEKVKNTYDSNGKLIENKDGLGRKTTYSYGKDGRPVEVVKPDGESIYCSYDERGNIIGILDPYGEKTVYEYDHLNRVISSIDPNGGKTVYGYDNNNRMIKIVNPLGQAISYEYNACGKQTKIRQFDGTTIQIEYNKLSKPCAYINNDGKRVELNYDSMWNVSEVVLPEGARKKYVYDHRNRLSSVIDEMGDCIQYEYDPNGNKIVERSAKGEETRYTYNARNQVDSVTDSEGNITKYRYDQNGYLVEKIDPLGNSEKYEYDLAGQKVSETDILGNTTKYTYTALGDIATITDPKGRITNYSYDAGGRVSEISYPTNRKEQFTYDKNGNLKTRSDSTGSSIAYEYDCIDRLIKMSKSNGEEITYTYDARGNITSMTDGLGNCTKYQYSMLDELKEVTDALGNKTQYKYNALGYLQEIRELGENPHVTRYERNLRGQVTAVIDALGFKEEYTYDANGRLVEKQDKDGYVTSYGYTSVGELNAIHYADGREVNLTFNPLHQLVEVKDWLGVTKIQNDPFGRIEHVKYPDGREVSYALGEEGERRSLTYPDGKTVYYEYDDVLRLTRLREDDNVISYTYDELGRMTKKDFSNGMSSDYSYDQWGRLKTLCHQDTLGVLDQYDYEYDLLGNKTKIEKRRRGLDQENGVWEYGYDPLRRLSTVKKDGRQLRDYDYDAFGNRIVKQEENRKTTYEYNALNQLISQLSIAENKNTATQYTYDRRGNLTAVTEDGRIESTFEYGALNRLEEATNRNGKQSRYEYNGLGYRVAKQIGFFDAKKEQNPLDDIRKQTMNPEQQILYTVDLTRHYNNLLEKKENGITENYLWDEAVVGMSGQSESNFYFQDELGSPIRLLDSDGTLVESYDYDEFGKQQDWNSNSIQPFGYIGYQTDSVTGTYFAQAREYQADTGRFISQDIMKGTSVVPQSMNPYVYCLNCPIELVDLNGMEPYIPFIQGEEAHRLLQLKYLADMPNQYPSLAKYPGAVLDFKKEFTIKGGRLSNLTKDGRADIVFFNSATKTIEVYEIKSGSYAKENYDDGSVNPYHTSALTQLDGYIFGLRNNPTYRGWKVKRGSTLNAYFNAQLIDSVKFPGQEIKYNVYQDGLIIYNYRKKTEPDPEPETELQPQPGPAPDMQLATPDFGGEGQRDTNKDGLLVAGMALLLIGGILLAPETGGLSLAPCIL